MVDGSAVNTEETQQIEQAPGGSSSVPAYVNELKDKGIVVLSADSEEELNGMIGNIHPDVRFYAGAVGYDYDAKKYQIQINRKEE